MQGNSPFSWGSLAMEEIPNSTPLFILFNSGVWFPLQAYFQMNEVETSAEQLHCSHHIKLLIQLKNSRLDQATWDHNFSPNYQLIKHASLRRPSGSAGSLWFLFPLDSCSCLTCGGGKTSDWNKYLGAKKHLMPNRMFQNRICPLV